MSALESLEWLDSAAEVKGPKAVLDEYAKALTSKSGGKVKGVVEAIPLTTVTGPGEYVSSVTYRINADVPDLRGYRTTLFETDDHGAHVWSEEELQDLRGQLDETFRSDDFKQTVRGLISAAS